MLKPLYDYALRKDLTLAEGYSKKVIKAFIQLYADGSFQGVTSGNEDELLVPDIGSLAQGKDKCNVLSEKRSIVTFEEPNPDLKKFITALKNLGKSQKSYLLFAQVLESGSNLGNIRQRLSELRIMPEQRFCFSLNEQIFLDDTEDSADHAEVRILLGEDGSYLGVKALNSETRAEVETCSQEQAQASLNRDISSQVRAINQQNFASLFSASDKSLFFIDGLKKAAEVEPSLLFCAQALEDPETLCEIRCGLDALKIKGSDRIAFKVASQDLLSTPALQSWWKHYRSELLLPKETNKTLVPCLITGELVQPLDITPKINGLFSVGGHSSGDALICFDKDAFCSYNLKQANNAPVVESAMSAVKAALESLLAEAPVIAGSKLVYWYDKDLPPGEDPIQQSFVPVLENSSFEYDEDEEEESPEEKEKERIEEERQKERTALKEAEMLVQRIQTDEQASASEDFSYYILMLSGVGGRIMIRRYERGSFRDLKTRLQQWQDDLSLCKVYKDGEMNPCKLVARLLRLLSFKKSEKNVYKRLNKELAGITPAILDAILTGTPLPDAVPVKALAYIRSSMLAANEDEQSDTQDLFAKDACVWQWLKVWLLRNKGKRGMLMCHYNDNYVSETNAYYCGALVAIYEAIQKIAMPEVKVSVVQRYYGSAIQTPALVLGNLSRMSVHHLAKIENEWLRDNFQQKLNQVSTHIQGKIPSTLNLEAQSEFALGYYQMNAAMEKEKRDNKAIREAKAAAKTVEADEQVDEKKGAQ